MRRLWAWIFGGELRRPTAEMFACAIASLGIVAFMVGCSSSGASPQRTTPFISVSISQNPPATMVTAGTAMVSATVSNDTANAGVDWIPVCGSAPQCGSFSPAHTASGGTTTFTAPFGVPSGKTVAVTAMSTTDRSKTSSSSVTITSTVTGVTFTQGPPSNVAAGGTVNLSAAVSGDSANAGIDWKANCGGIDCTSGFLPPHTAPGLATAFTVPVTSAQFPMIVGSTVTITAFATADHTFSATATFVVSGPISLTITQQPPANISTNGTATMTATVANDASNSGVTWQIFSCDNSPCGTWQGTPVNCGVGTCVQVNSGATATYVAPAIAESNVTIRVFATAAPTTTATTVSLSVTPPISVALTTQIVNGTIVRNASASLVATVSNDTANAGIDWTVTCGSTGACGSFNPAHTASGDPTSYTAPAAVPSGNTVTITATSTTDPTMSASQTVTVTAGVVPNSLLLGQSVVLLNGHDQNGGPYALGGVIVGDGQGNITKGSLDLVDMGGGPGNENAGNVPALPSTYNIGPDGRGQLQITVNTASLAGNFGVNASGTITVDIVFVTSRHALLNEIDAFGTATGTLDLQNATDLAAFQAAAANGPKGVYSLSLAGSEVAGTHVPYFVNGAITLTPSATSYTETAYVADQSDAGKITSAAYHTASHTFSNPLPNTYGELQLDSVNLGLATQFNLNLWLIDRDHFVVTDWRDSFAGTPDVFLGGYATIQPSTPAIAGTFVFAEAGSTAAPALTIQAAGGVFTCGGAGTLDVTPFQGTPVNVPAITAACTAPANGRGLITLTGAGSSGISKFAAYPTINEGLYIVELDGGAAGTAGPSGAGSAIQQTLAAPIAASAFNGKYGASYATPTTSGFVGLGGQVTSNGASTLGGNLDANSFTVAAPSAGSPSLGTTVAGTFTAGADGRFSLTFTLTPATGQPTPEVTNFSPACYLIDSNRCLLLGLDASAPGAGILWLQNTGL